jgi:peptidoglycan/LPS O-acetylase OafA/YrhL
MPELDSIRGIAIMLVLFFHGMSPPLSPELSRGGKFILAVSQHGSAGVNLFFVLSGFLITGILIDSRNHAGYYRRFYIRRALRILPAFYATLLILLVGGWISWRFLALSVLFLANTTPLLGVPLQYGPLWSLAVEEHFYMLWPAIVRRLSPLGLMLLLTAILAITPGTTWTDWRLGRFWPSGCDGRRFTERSYRGLRFHCYFPALHFSCSCWDTPWLNPLFQIRRATSPPPDCCRACCWWARTAGAR